VCTDCADLRVKYDEEVSADPALAKKLADVEAIQDPAVKLAKTEELHLEMSRARSDRLQPPKDASGAPDFDAWGARLKARGVTGDIDATVARAKAGGEDGLAAQGELRSLERARLRGYHVEALSPPVGPSAPKGAKTPEAKITRGTEELRLEVKTATDPPSRATWNAHADKANAQIKGSGKRGEISFDWTGTDVRAGGDFGTQADIENFLNGKMTDTRLRSVDRFEVVWKAPDGSTMVTTRVRGPDGKVGPVSTERL
jgi:hypothetical protein